MVERIEPRNNLEQEGRQPYSAGSPHNVERKASAAFASSGSETMACWILGLNGNPGDPTESHKDVSKLEQSIIKRELIDAK